MSHENYTLKIWNSWNICENVSFIAWATNRHLNREKDKRTNVEHWHIWKWLMPCFMSASKLAPLKQIWTFWTSTLKDFRLTLPWKTSQSGGNLVEKICSDPRNCRIENFKSSYPIVPIALSQSFLSFVIQSWRNLSVETSDQTWWF